MKKLILLAISITVSACSTPEQQSSVPMDMKTVQDYQYRVSSGNTVDKTKPSASEELNQSDRRTRNVIYHRPVPVIYPSIHYGHWYY